MTEVFQWPEWAALERAFMPDSNVLLDVISEDPVWSAWSEAALNLSQATGIVAINQVIFAEISPPFGRIEDIQAFLQRGRVQLEELPWDAAFLAGQAFREYRKHGGPRTSPLNDFFIGAHALLRDYTLITRDPRRYRTYFPNLKLVAPGP